MSDTTETAVRRLREDSPIVDVVCARLRDAVDPSDADFAVAFAEIFLSKAPPDFISERSEQDLSAAVLGAFTFLKGSRLGRVDVQVINPDEDSEGWFAPVTVVRTNITERPFVVDTVREFLHSQDLAIEHIVYPVLHVERDESGAPVAVRPSRDGQARESLVHCEVDQVSDSETRSFLQREVESRLQDVVRATDDFPVMLDRVNDVVTELEERAAGVPELGSEIREIQAFLRWLRDGGFVFLGYRAYDLVGSDEDDDRHIIVEAGSGLGVLRNEAESTFAAPVAVSSLDEGMRQIVERGPLLMVSKTNAESTIHRRARMDYIGIKKLAPDGTITGEHRFLGLFTSKAYAEDAESIPILRQKLGEILDESGVREGSHDYKEIITIFNTLPKEEIFLTSAGEVGEDIRTVLTSYHTADVRVSIREDALKRGVAVMVILPKDKFSGAVRMGIEAALVERLDAQVLNYHLALGEGDQARLHFHLATPSVRLDLGSTDALEQEVRELTRSWSDHVRSGLELVRPADEARRLSGSYGVAFSAEYQAATDPEIAVGDILELEAMVAEDRDISIAFANRGMTPGADSEEATELKVYLRDQRLILSDFLPILENTGLRVVAVNPFEVAGDGVGRARLYVFAVQDATRRPLDIEARGDLLAETILAVRAGDAISDSLNRLVVAAGLHWREVDVLRAYTGYAFQIGAVPSRLSLPAALVKHPGIARDLFELFRTCFQPQAFAALAHRLIAVEDLRTSFHTSLQSVASLADDRALRRLQQLIHATVRTNFYRHGGAAATFRSGGVPYISFKFSCRDLDFLSRTALMYEVWVHSARMEGVHLRGSRVARGGIRWSDRPDDFRTEIMGLVRTQVVKNAVIVPGGSKGGFVTRWESEDPEERFEEARAQYQTLVRGLLDLTDDYDGQGGTVPPEAVVAYDQPDPYLVVAADKGTATFSDTANAVSAEYDFWLDDAFASGGSNGYDHKEVGITARGAWECVKRHFREKDKDIQSEPFTVVGIGDMSGDVFGNGMLLSEKIRLIAAFDHRHVFIDPTPDEATGFAERARMFALGRSSWDAYDQSLLSEGGMIVPRTSKEVELSPEARKALGIPDEEGSVMDGETLVRAVLKAPVELLWNGGIGTYVKATTETDTDAGDPANDAVRIDAPELRCEVVGEGGNLGLTQRARIQFALNGGRINTDALDNSGGVDMSDHEVNLKILLAPVVASGGMTESERNELLEELTESVAQLVLDDNRSQSLAISLDELRVKESADDLRDLMFALEKTGELDRMSESLPTLDVLVERRDRGRTLVRPELCVLLAYSKLALKTRLLRGGLADDAVGEDYLTAYFPAKAVAAAGHEVLWDHRLRREIVVSQITNDLVDLMGAGFVGRVIRDTGRSAEEVARAWLVASRLAEHRTLLKEMAKQQSALNSRVTYRWLLGLTRVLDRTTRWVLQNTDPGTPPGSLVKENARALASLREDFAAIVDGEERSLFEARVKEIQALGAEEGFSRRLITLRFLDQLLEIANIAREAETEEVATGKAFYAVSGLFNLPWLRRVAFAAAGDDSWQQRAAQLLTEDLSGAHRRLVLKVLREDGAVTDPRGVTRTVLESHAAAVERFSAVVEEIKAEGEESLAAATVAVRELSALSERFHRR